MAKSKKGYHKKKQFTIPLAIVAGLTPAALDLKGAWDQYHNVTALGVETGRIFLGWDFWGARWNPGFMKWGTFPLVGGIVVHKLANKFGINRALSRAGIPLIRI